MGADSITFLGTGGDIIVVGKSFRTSGGFVVKTENCQLHFDPGVGALAKAIHLSTKKTAESLFARKLY